VNAPDAFDDFWRTAWKDEPSTTTDRRFEWMVEALRDRRYGRVLEVGCGDGSFTRRLSTLADHVLALDVSPEAIRRAREVEASGIDFRVADVMDFPLADEGPWNLVVLSETMPYLGWLRTFFDVGWLAAELYETIGPEGRLLMVNTSRGLEDWLYRPWLVQTYHDLFRNVGFAVEREARLTAGQEEQLEFRLSLYRKPQAR
jgi:predicted TPR repeat methyltransferase